MSGRGGGFRQSGRVPRIQPLLGSLSRGGSASGYSYFNSGNHNHRGGGAGNSGRQRERGGSNWGHPSQGFEGQQWSSNASNEDFGFSQNLGNFGQRERMNPGGMRGAKRPAPLLPIPPTRGRRGRGAILGGSADSRIARKRPSNTGHDARMVKRRHHDAAFGNQSNLGFMGDLGNGGGWMEGPSLFDQYHDDWRQLPGGSQWDFPEVDFFNEEDVYPLQFGFREHPGRGRRENSRRRRDRSKNAWKGKKEIKEHHEKWKQKESSIEDKLLHQKHKTLTQLKEERKSLLQAVRSVMSALKVAGETLSQEAKALMEVTNTESKSIKQQDDKTTPEISSTEATEAVDEQTASDHAVMEPKDGAEKEVTTASEVAVTKPENNVEPEAKATSETISTESAGDVEQKDKNESDVAMTELEKVEGQETEPTAKIATADNKSSAHGLSENAQGKKLETVKSGKKKSVDLPPQVILGVVRVGAAQRKLLIKGAQEPGEELVVIFKNKPTKEMLGRIATLIEFNLKSPISEKVIIIVKEEEERIVINLSGFDCPFRVNISFTSPAFSKESDEEEKSCKQEDDQSDLLSAETCIVASSKIRRIRWAKKAREELELPVVRIFLDFAARLDGWKHLSSYATEVLVNTVMDKLAKDTRESEHTISRIFIQCVELLAEGLILQGGPGLKDPCEAGSVDIFKSLKPQEAEDLTKAAQFALRSYACGRLKDLLNL